MERVDTYIDWYANHHQHDGLRLFSPADVFFRRVDSVITLRQSALDAAYAAHPERFVHGRPIAKRPPHVVAINLVDPKTPDLIPIESFLSRPDLVMCPPLSPLPVPVPVHIQGATPTNFLHST